MAGITSISVAGYKSIAREQTIEIRPLTILAGANSSGKSSIMQPLLLLKQTLEASYDPGPLLLDGPNIRLTSANQMFSKITGNRISDLLRMAFETKRGSLELEFRFDRRSRIQIEKVVYTPPNREPLVISPGLSQEEIHRLAPEWVSISQKMIDPKHPAFQIVRERCFLAIGYPREDGTEVIYQIVPDQGVVSLIESLIHVPGLRRNPERTYPSSAFGPKFPGEFQNYVASIIEHWQSIRIPAKLDELGNTLANLQLTSKVEAKRLDDTRIEIRVGRLPRPKRGTGDMVSIADVGLGVSQVLPVVVALLVAKPGDMVYLEEPEIHLHPRAQVHLAGILATAAKRGVIVVAETHSSLLLRRIQTLVARSELDPKIVKLHWFKRSQVDGSTTVRSADLDREGAFGPWPSDFGDVSLKAEKEYLDAVYATGSK